ncbi:MAG: alpha/beta hydrolase [Planctomycetota bacterium]
MIRAFRQKLLDRFVLRPTRHRLPYAPKERLVISDSGTRDELFVQRPLLSQHESEDPGADEFKPPELIVFKFPGTAGRAERASDWPASALGCVDVKLFTWNPPGYGRSSGRASLTSIAERATKMFQVLTEDTCSSHTKVWLVGNSLGCATAVWVANQFANRVDGLVIRNPPPLVQTVKRVAHRYPGGRWTDRIAESLPASMDLLRTAHGIQLPTVVLQSEYDKLVPPELQLQVYDAIRASKRLVVMRGLGHDGVATEQHEPEINEAIRWLWQEAETNANASSEMSSS